MSISSQEPQHNLFLFIPATIADDPDLDDSTKMLFGRITALSNNKGYCWAGDKYLADLCRCKDRVITDRLKALEDKGYILRETEKIGMNWHRKIMPIFNNFKKILTKGTPVPLEGHDCALSKGTPVPHNKISINNIIKQQQQQQQKAQAPAAAPVAKASKQQPKIYDCLKDVDIPEIDKIEITRDYSEQVVIKAVKWATHPQTKINKSLAAAIKWACQNNPEIPVLQQDQEKVNKEYAMRYKDMRNNYSQVDVCNTFVEIANSGVNGSIVVNYSDNGFMDQFHSALRKNNFKIYE